MINKIIISTFVSLLVLLDIQTAFARTWNIDKATSSLGFSAVVNGAHYDGNFKTFDGQISFDPDKLESSQIKITIGMGSVAASYQDMGKTLTGADWFDAKSFPSATYEAGSFTKTGDKTYQANGNLTIRGKTVPVVLSFTLNEYTPTKAVVTGSTAIRRNDFGVGQGEWAGTDVVQNEVTVNFTIKATGK